MCRKLKLTEQYKADSFIFCFDYYFFDLRFNQVIKTKPKYSVRFVADRINATVNPGTSEGMGMKAELVTKGAYLVKKLRSKENSSIDNLFPNTQIFFTG